MSARFFLFVFANLCLCQIAWSHEGSTQGSRDQEVRLSGQLKEVNGFGPPGFGEDKKVDAPIKYWILDLPKYINIPCTPEKPEWVEDDCKSAKQLKLFFPLSPSGNGLELKAKALRGRHIVAMGVLHRADTAGQITPIYMDVTEIKATRISPRR